MPGNKRRSRLKQNDIAWLKNGRTQIALNVLAIPRHRQHYGTIPVAKFALAYREAYCFAVRRYHRFDDSPFRYVSLDDRFRILRSNQAVGSEQVENGVGFSDKNQPVAGLQHFFRRDGSQNDAAPFYFREEYPAQVA